MPVVGPAKSWRLVHDGSTVISLFESEGLTESIHSIFEAATEEECESQIDLLGLDFPAPPSSGVEKLSSLQFMERFSQETQLKVVAATKSNDLVKLWYDKMLAADEIVLTDPRTIAGVQAMVALGIISKKEAAQALA